ncbi:MAG: cobalamin biosynthesis protein [Amaricoccus sp.]|uniref:cobalamin biosynthesis protein n=1 Tax=Amaricoccus sp. TaxID=1872485 RepID=UPI0039E6F8F5
MVLGEAVTVAGLGSRRGVALAEVLAAVAAARAACGGLRLDALATLPLKAAEPGLAAAARHLGLPLLIASPAGDDRLMTRSAASRAATGSGSAAEAAALGAAGPDARLVSPRLVLGRVTCAIATSRAIATTGESS